MVALKVNIAIVITVNVSMAMGLLVMDTAIKFLGYVIYMKNMYMKMICWSNLLVKNYSIFTGDTYFVP